MSLSRNSFLSVLDQPVRTGVRFGFVPFLSDHERTPLDEGFHSWRIRDASDGLAGT